MKSEIVVLLAGIVVAGSQASAGSPHERSRTMVESYPLEEVSGVRLLVVDTLWGGIRVRAVAGDEVRMKAVRSDTAESAAWLERAESEVSLDVTVEPGRLELFVDGPWRSRERRGEWAETGHLGYEVAYDFELEVPVGTALDLKTVGRGAIELVGTDGLHRVSNVTGDVRLDGVAGSGRFESVSGSVSGSFIESPSKESGFKTVSGDLEVAFPADLSAELSVSAKWGEIWSAFPLEPIASLPAVSERRGGRLRIESNGGGRFRVGRGGAELRFETLSGEIRIGRSEAR